MIIRKNAAKLPSTEQLRYVTALKALKADIQGNRNGVPYGVYDQVVALHLGVTSRIQNNQSIGDGAHGTPAFLPWHRQYLLWLEGMLRAVDARVSIPYWDWVDAAGTQSEIFANDFIGPPGSGLSVGAVTTGHFAAANGWPIVNELHRRGVNTGTLGTALLRRTSFNFSTLPPASRITTIQGRNVFDHTAFQTGFRPDLEGDPHGTLHGWIGGIGGTMSGMSSPNDPIFFLHHAAVDRLWARWQVDGHSGSSFYPANFPGVGHGLQSPMWPWDGGGGTTLDWITPYLPGFGGQVVRPADVLDSTGIAVLYDSLLPIVSAGGSLSVSVGAVDDENGVRVLIASSGRYRIVAQGSGDVELGLYGPDDWDEVTLRNGTGILDITVDLSPGEYFVTLRGRSATPTSRTLSLIEVSTIVVLTTPVSVTVDGGRVSAQIGAPGETDEYRFTVATSGQYTIETHGETDVVMWLFGPNNQNALVAEDDDSGEDRNAQITVQLTPGDYVVRVRHYFPSQTGTYEIDVRSTGALSSNDLQVDGPPVAQQISTAGEIDVLTVQIAQSGNYRFRTGGALDTVLFIIDQANTSQLVGWNDDANGTLNSQVDLSLPAGNYFVVVRLYSSAQTGDYSVQVERRP